MRRLITIYSRGTFHPFIPNNFQSKNVPLIAVNFLVDKTKIIVTCSAQVYLCNQRDFCLSLWLADLYGLKSKICIVSHPQVQHSQWWSEWDPQGSILLGHQSWRAFQDPLSNVPSKSDPHQSLQESSLIKLMLTIDILMSSYITITLEKFCYLGKEYFL